MDKLEITAIERFINQLNDLKELECNRGKYDQAAETRQVILKCQAILELKYKELGAELLKEAQL
jgi:hypothetical protein